MMWHCDLKQCRQRTNTQFGACLLNLVTMTFKELYDSWKFWYRIIYIKSTNYIFWAFSFFNDHVAIMAKLQQFYNMSNKRQESIDGKSFRLTGRWGALWMAQEGASGHQEGWWPPFHPDIWRCSSPDSGSPLSSLLIQEDVTVENIWAHGQSA